MREREVKFSAGPTFRLPDFSGLAEGVVAVDGGDVRLKTSYYDTPDLRIARWGCSLRHRQNEGWTVKLPATIDGIALEREEIVVPDGSPATPPRELLAFITAYARHTPLAVVARLSTLRRRILVQRSSGEPAAEIVDDEVSVLEGRRVAARFREIEVESKADADDLLPAIVKRLREAGAGAADPTPELLRALGQPALEPPEVAVVGLGQNPAATEVITRSLAKSVAILLKNDPGVRVGGDPEYVHKARSATRQLRSNLRTFGPLLDEAWTASLREELGWLADVLGRVRDSEVMLERLRGDAVSLPEADQRLANRLLDQLIRQLDGYRADLVGAMNSERYIRLVEALVVGAGAPMVTTGAERRAADVLPELASAPWRRLRKAVRGIGKQPSPEELHRIRILAKRARYAAEAAAPAVGGKAARFARALSRLQGTLGEHQDSITAQAWLREAARSSGTAFVSGELAAMESAAAARARRKWRKNWEAAARKPLRGWLPRRRARTG